MVINFRSLSEVSHLRIDTPPLVVGGVLLFFLVFFILTIITPLHEFNPSAFPKNVQSISDCVMW